MCLGQAGISDDVQMPEQKPSFVQNLVETTTKAQRAQQSLNFVCLIGAIALALGLYKWREMVNAAQEKDLATFKESLLATDSAKPTIVKKVVQDVERGVLLSKSAPPYSGMIEGYTAEEILPMEQKVIYSPKKGMPVSVETLPPTRRARSPISAKPNPNTSQKISPSLKVNPSPFSGPQVIGSNIGYPTTSFAQPRLAGASPVIYPGVMQSPVRSMPSQGGAVYRL